LRIVEKADDLVGTLEEVVVESTTALSRHVLEDTD
jgi:hypothetical protein